MLEKLDINVKILAYEDVYYLSLLILTSILLFLNFKGVIESGFDFTAKT